MPHDLEDELLADRWREGLRALAEPGDATGVADRVLTRAHARRRRRLVAGGVGVLIGVVAIGGGIVASRSGSGNQQVRAGGPSHARPAPGRFQLRPVLAVGSPPCQGGQVAGVAGAADRCYTLGPVALDGRDVVSVSVSTQRQDGVGLDIRLSAEGMARFNTLARQGFGVPSPRNEVAMVVDGRVVSAPQFQTSHFEGDEVRVSGSFTDAQAREFASAIGPIDDTTSTTVVPSPLAPDARTRATLALWSGFPVNASPRPLVVSSDTELLGTTGFPDNASKEAYLAGAFVPPADFPSGPATAGGYPVISARDAFAALKGAGTPPASPTSLAVTGVRLGVATFRTDRGPRTLPAWLFSFRSVADPAAVLAVAPSARFTPIGLDQFAPTGGATFSLIHEGDVARVSSDGTEVTLTFTGDAPGSGPCTADYAARAIESRTAVAVVIGETRLPTGVCAGVGHERQASVTLKSPLGARVLIDAMTGQALTATP